jgi:hypothetical protein
MGTDDLKTTLLQILASFEEVMPFVEQDVRRLIDLYAEKAIFEPTTVRATLEKWSTEHHISEEFRTKLDALKTRLPRSNSEDFPWSQPGNEFFHFISGIKEALGAGSLAERLRPVLTTEVRFIYRAQMLEAIRQPTTVSFERRVRVLAEVLRNTIEGWYKLILQTALRLARETSGKPIGDVPGELGPVLTACVSAGKIPTSILEPKLRIVRNAVAHSHTEVDVQHETVTFVNVSRSGKRDELGPWNWDELTAFSESSLMLFWTLTLVLRRHLRFAETETKPST